MNNNRDTSKETAEKVPTAIHYSDFDRHVIPLHEILDPIVNVQILEKCKHCGYYYNFRFRAEQCV